MMSVGREDHELEKSILDPFRFSSFLFVVFLLPFAIFPIEAQQVGRVSSPLATSHKAGPATKIQIRFRRKR
jgi:hypothetical protein